MGRTASTNGNGHAVLPPALGAELAPAPPPEPHPGFTRYRQPPPRRGGVARTLVRGTLWLLASAAVVALGLAGGTYLYLEEDVVGAVKPHDRELREAAEALDIVPPDQPAIALLIGYDKRAAGANQVDVPRSDTLMLVRADPRSKTLSLLSFPRDLLVDVHCPGAAVVRAKINAAYSMCGVKGTLATVRQLTGLPVNYLVTVNFRGFKQLVARVGGVWVDVDRRYFNDQAGIYATIDLQPGYQKLQGADSLDFVRYRHLDSDLFRLARQQQFVSAFRAAVTSSFSATKIPRIVKTITDNVQVATPGNKELDIGTLKQYALLAYQLPRGHVFQSKLEGLEDSGDGEFNVLAPEGSVAAAVEEFVSPDIQAPEKATDVALGRKPPASKAPAPADTSVVVLNGNGVAGAAANTSYLLAQRGYKTVTPATRADAPSYDYFHTAIYYDPQQVGSQQAAKKLGNLFAPADVARMPQAIRPLQGGAMAVVVVGQTFEGELAPAPVDRTPEPTPPAVVTNPDASESLVREAQKQVRFPLMVPTVLETTSLADRSVPVRVHKMAGRQAVRLVYTNGALEYWGVEMTTWRDAPVLDDPNKVLRIKGRRYELHYAGSKLHMVVLRTPRATYWVVNTLLNALSNETMLAIAKGLKPLGNG